MTHGCEGPSHFRRHRMRRYVGARLHRRLFLFMGLAILVTFALLRCGPIATAETDWLTKSPTRTASTAWSATRRGGNSFEAAAAAKRAGVRSRSQRALPVKSPGER